MKIAIQYIKANADKLTAQQRKTLIGQCKAGDIDGALKGLHKILRAL